MLKDKNKRNHFVITGKSYHGKMDGKMYKVEYQKTLTKAQLGELIIQIERLMDKDR